jgi:Trk-type K+ transport system membrane component
MAPYIMAGGRYEYVFDAQPQEVSTPWFALFQAVSAFSNTGMSLADQSMIPFQQAYVMVAREYSGSL